MHNKILRHLSFSVAAILFVVLGVLLTPMAGFAHTSPKSIWPFVPCDVGEYWDMTYNGSTFTPLDTEHIIRNGGSNNVTQTVSVEFTTSIGYTVSAEYSGKVKFLLAEASIKLGISVTGSQSSKLGTSTTVIASPHTELHIQYGTNLDHFSIHHYYRHERCNLTNESWGSFDAPASQTIWTTWEKRI